MAISFQNLPFDEAIEYFRSKVNLPSEHWTDVWQQMHQRAFTVAGAMQDDILTDFKKAIDDAISKGGTITDFRKTFDEVVARTGWSYKGNRGWRTATIFNTNMRVAHSVGAYKQLEAVRATRPYWRYVGGLSENPRPLHLKWNGLVLPADDPWWDTHFPPNGWGCKCQVVSHSGRELTRMGLSVARSAPNDGKYEWANPKTGEIIEVPNGIDPGWAYNPGKAGFKDAA